jgi:transposase
VLRSAGRRAERPKAHAAATPVRYDVQDYKQRNIVERFFNRIKNWRGLTSRYDKHALVCRGGVVLAAIPDWLR